MTLPVRRHIPFSDGIISLLEWEALPGAPTLIFSHANGFNASTYKTVLQPLAGRFRILAWDMRGHGETALPTDKRLLPGWRVFRDDLIRLIDKLAIRVDVLAGHSLGASTSLLAAAARPDIARALVLAEPVLTPDAAALKAYAARLTGRSHKVVMLAGMALKRRAEFASREDAVKRFTGRGAFATWPAQMVADYVETGLVAHGEAYRLACAPHWEAAAFGIYPFRMAALGRRIKVPVTILSGTRNSATTKSVLDGLMRRHGHVRFLSVEDASHFLPMEQPEILRAEILRAAGLI